jgi:multidrug efflux pump subunit AcrA (membrane-fusion protein)
MHCCLRERATHCQNLAVHQETGLTAFLFMPEEPLDSRGELAPSLARRDIRNRFERIRPQVGGYVIGQDYKEGTEVRKGQVLFEIDPRPWQATEDRARGSLSQAKAQYKLATINVVRDTPFVRPTASISLYCYIAAAPIDARGGWM